jgi:hypothetical protein
MQADFKMNLLSHVESTPILEENLNHYTEIDSELIEDDSILDYDEKEEIIENVYNEEGASYNSDESSESELNCYSEFTTEEHKVQFVSASEHTNQNEILKQKEMNGYTPDRSVQDYKPAEGRIWKWWLTLAPNVSVSGSFTNASQLALEADTSGVTDIEMIVESHKDLMQYIYLLAQVNEENLI